MAVSFTVAHDARTPAEPRRRKVLVTGAAGNIGSVFAKHASDRYELTLMVRALADGEHIRRYGKLEQADLADLPRLTALCRGQDTVLHLAADPSPEALWDSLLPNNIVGTYNMFTAAKAAGCRRIVYASSIHAITGYPRSYQAHADDPVNPGDLYGVTKCFAEALGRYLSTKEGISCICIRIGAFQSLEAAREPSGMAYADAFVSHRDCCQLIQLCIDDERLQFAIVHGLSDNRFNRMDITEGLELLGYRPQDDFTRVNAELRKLELADRVPAHSKGSQD